MTDNQVIPLFPLGIVALPGLPIPLHIFEERYKLMVGECLEQDRPFGIVFFSGGRLQNAGCTVRVIQLIKRYEDGRMDILTRGENRFLIQKLFEDKPYLQASVRYFQDQPEDFNDDMAGSAQKGLQALEELTRLLTGRAKSEPIDTDDIEQLSFFIAGCEGFSAEEKQAFLEMTSTRIRLQKSTRAMSALIERIRLTEKIKSVINGNGHLNKLPGADTSLPQQA